MSSRAVIDELCLLASLESCLKTQTTVVIVIIIETGRPIYVAGLVPLYN